MKSSYLKKLMEEGTGGQDIPQQLMHILGGLFEHVPELPVSLMKLFSCYKPKHHHGNTLLKCWIIRISQLSDFRLMKFCHVA
jgi:hypothetical protein